MQCALKKNNKKQKKKKKKKKKNPSLSIELGKLYTYTLIIMKVI